jgi:hypothetical protein
MNLEDRRPTQVHPTDYLPFDFCLVYRFLRRLCKQNILISSNRGKKTGERMLRRRTTKSEAF